MSFRNSIASSISFSFYFNSFFTYTLLDTCSPIRMVAHIHPPAVVQQRGNSAVLQKRQKNLKVVGGDNLGVDCIKQGNKVRRRHGILATIIEPEIEIRNRRRDHFVGESGTKLCGCGSLIWSSVMFGVTKSTITILMGRPYVLLACFVGAQ